MAIEFDPLPPWHQVATVLCAAAIFIILVGSVVRKERWEVLGHQRVTRSGVFLLSTLTALFLALAVWNPRSASKQEPPTAQVVLLLDVSESVLRSSQGWSGIQAKLGDYLSVAIKNSSADFVSHGKASLLTFGRNVASVENNLPLKDLPAAVRRLTPARFAAGDASDLAGGLSRAEKLLLNSPGAGIVILVSDGQQTQGDALLAAQRLAQLGIPVQVIPVEGAAPAIAITSANLPRQVNAQEETFVRGLVWNRTDTDQGATLHVSQNIGLGQGLAAFGSEKTGSTEVVLPQQNWLSFRQTIFFQGVGLQYVDLNLTPNSGIGNYQRRFFTHVHKPPRLLAVGGDQRWTGAFSSDVIEIVTANPGEVQPDVDFTLYDAIVINDVTAGQFPNGALENLVKAIEKDGIGLMLVNGGHHGLSEEAPTVVMSYNGTPLEPLLPLSSQPRPFTPEPPPRNVILVVDTSGSMDGPRLEKAKEIMRYIVEELLRPQDRLDLLTFTTGAAHLVKDQQMDASGKSQAIQAVNSIVAGGGTDPTAVLTLIANMKPKNCGLIFLSDGEFGGINVRPDCRATAFAIGYDTVPPNSPLWALSDPFPVSGNFDPASIKMPYFQPQPRDKFFEPGMFVPISMETYARRVDPLPIPPLPLQGAAITYPKDEATLIAARPKLTDPVLAFKENGAGYVGEFTGEFSPEWVIDPAGQNAVLAWLERIIPYSARERYDFVVHDFGSSLEIQVAVVADGLIVPEVSSLSGLIEVNGKAVSEVPFRPDALAPATFIGQIEPPRSEQAQPGALVLREAGAGALARAQRIPIILPPISRFSSSATQETFTYGLNRELLQAIANVGGGSFEPDPRDGLGQFSGTVRLGLAFWPWLILAATFCYLAAVALRRLDP